MADKYISDGGEFIRQRVFTYAEYEFVSPDLAEPLRGTGNHENGRTYNSRWLTPVQPPFCPFADRGTCSEFRMLSSFCDLISFADPHSAGDSEARNKFTGFLRALVSGPCCVSCVGAFAQFSLLFPNIDIRIAAGKMPSLLT